MLRMKRNYCDADKFLMQTLNRVKHVAKRYN